MAEFWKISGANGSVTYGQGGVVPKGAQGMTEANFQAEIAAATEAFQGDAARVITYKADLYRRCTDAEADAIEVALMAASVRQRRLFESAQYLDHSDPLFTTMHEAMVGMFGEDRTAVLLAAS